MGEERLSTVYHVVSTNSEKASIGSLWGMNLTKRLGTYKRDSVRGHDNASRWIREVGVDSLRIIPMITKVCTMREIRRLEQESIEYCNASMCL